MPWSGTYVAPERCEIQPEGVSGGLAAERPRGYENETGSIKGWCVK